MGFSFFKKCQTKFEVLFEKRKTQKSLQKIWVSMLVQDSSLGMQDWKEWIPILYCQLVWSTFWKKKNTKIFAKDLGFYACPGLPLRDAGLKGVNPDIVLSISLKYFLKKEKHKNLCKRFGFLCLLRIPP